MSDPRADRDAYLDRVAARLHLPEDHASEVIEELRGHLAESVAGLLDEGLTPDQAERESIARLGNPGELADGIRTARQTRRRLLAAAGSGAVAAVGGVVWGYLFAAALLTIAGIASTILLSLALGSTSAATSGPVMAVAPGWLGLSNGSRTVTDLLSIPFALFIPGYAAHRLVGAFADRLARSVTTIRGPIALGGSVLLAVIALFIVPTDDGLIGVVVLLAIPIGFAFGALLARDGHAPRLRRMPGRWVLASLAVATATLMVAALATSEINPRDGHSAGSSTAVIGQDPIDVLGDGWLNQESTIGAAETYEVSIAPKPADLLEGWRDLRLEAWPAADPRTLDVAPTTDRPALTVPLTRDGAANYTAKLDLGQYKERRWFILATTGLAPNGTRYLLSGPDGAIPSRPWMGTVWEYLTSR